MRVLVFGSRKYRDFLAVVEYIMNLQDGDVVITGGAHGVDAWAANVAHYVCRCPNPCRHYPPRKNLATEVYFAQWLKYGKAAGPIRNTVLVRADIDCAAVFRADGVSKGTDDMLGKLGRARKPVHRHRSLQGGIPWE